MKCSTAVEHKNAICWISKDDFRLAGSPKDPGAMYSSFLNVNRLFFVKWHAAFLILTWINSVSDLRSHTGEGFCRMSNPIDFFCENGNRNLEFNQP